MYMYIFKIRKLQSCRVPGPPVTAVQGGLTAVSAAQLHILGGGPTVVTADQVLNVHAIWVG